MPAATRPACLSMLPIKRLSKQFNDQLLPRAPRVSSTSDLNTGYLPVRQDATNPPHQILNFIVGELQFGCSDRIMFGAAISQIALAACGLEVRSKWAGRVLTWCALLALSIYRGVISPFTGRRCQFNPSCSKRALEFLASYEWNRARVEIAAQLGRCIGHYIISQTDGVLEMHTSDGSVFSQEDIAPFIRDLYKSRTS